MSIHIYVKVSQLQVNAMDTHRNALQSQQSPHKRKCSRTCTYIHMQTVADTLCHPICHPSAFPSHLPLPPGHLPFVLLGHVDGAGKSKNSCVFLHKIRVHAFVIPFNNWKWLKRGFITLCITLIIRISLATNFTFILN